MYSFSSTLSQAEVKMDWLKVCGYRTIFSRYLTGWLMNSRMDEDISSLICTESVRTSKPEVASMSYLKTKLPFLSFFLHCCASCLECSNPTSMQGWIFLDLQCSTPMSSFETSSSRECLFHPSVTVHHSPPFSSFSTHILKQNIFTDAFIHWMFVSPIGSRGQTPHLSCSLWCP